MLKRVAPDSISLARKAGEEGSTVADFRGRRVQTQELVPMVYVR